MSRPNCGCGGAAAAATPPSSSATSPSPSSVTVIGGGPGPAGATGAAGEPGATGEPTQVSSFCGAAVEPVLELLRRRPGNLPGPLEALADGFERMGPCAQLAALILIVAVIARVLRGGR